MLPNETPPVASLAPDGQLSPETLDLLRKLYAAEPVQATVSTTPADQLNAATSAQLASAALPYDQAIAQGQAPMGQMARGSATQFQPYPLNLGGVESTINKINAPNRKATEADLAPYDAAIQGAAAAQEADMRVLTKAQGLYEQQQAQQLVLAQQQKQFQESVDEFKGKYAMREARVRHSGAGPSVSDEEIAQTEAMAQGKLPTSDPREVTAARNKLAQWDDTDPFKSSVFGKTGGHILAAIAAGLGAYGATLGHTQNFALKIIEDAIDRNIAKMREQHGQARDALEREFKINLENKADLAQVKMLQMQGAQNMLGLLKDQASTAEQINKYDTMISGLEQKKKELEQNGVGATIEQKLAAGGLAAHIAGIKLTEKASMMGANGDSPIPYTEYVKPSLGPPEKEGMDRARKIIAQSNTTIAILDKAIEFRKKHGVTLPLTDANKEAEAIFGEYQLERKKLADMGGALAGNEQGLLKDTAQNPGDWGYVLDQLIRTRQTLHEQINKSLEPYNLRYVPSAVAAAHLPESGR